VLREFSEAVKEISRSSASDTLNYLGNLSPDAGFFNNIARDNYVRACRRGSQRLFSGSYATPND
jgi:hypothetical protein